MPEQTSERATNPEDDAVADAPVALTTVEPADAAIWEFLETPGQRMVVATIEPDGQPHVTVVWYCILDQRRVGFTVRTDSRKVKNLARDPRITVMVDAGATHGELRGVQIAGRARLDRSPATKLEIHELVATRYATKPSPDIDRTMAKRTAVIVEAVRLAQWDHRVRQGAGVR